MVIITNSLRFSLNFDKSLLKEKLIFWGAKCSCCTKKATQQTLAELVFLTSSEAGESACLATEKESSQESLKGSRWREFWKPRPRPQLFSGQTGNLILKKKKPVVTGGWKVGGGVKLRWWWLNVAMIKGFIAVWRLTIIIAQVDIQESPLPAITWMVQISIYVKSLCRKVGPVGLFSGAFPAPIFGHQKIQRCKEPNRMRRWPMLHFCCHQFPSPTSKQVACCFHPKVQM